MLVCSNDPTGIVTGVMIIGKRHLANSWEEKALKVRLEMLSMADGE